MNELFPQIETWLAEGKQVALATVLKTWGASPVGVGAKMAISDQQEMIGSVSGGCVETAVISESEAVLATQKAKRLHYGVTDEIASSVGLACGGQVEILLQPLDPTWVAVWKKCYQEKIPALTSIGLEPTSKNFGKVLMVDVNAKEVLYQSLVDENQAFAFGLIGGAPSEIQVFSDAGEMIYYLEPMQFPLRLFIIGAVHIAQSLVPMAQLLGFETFVIDPRQKFLEGERFATADHVQQAWADEALENVQLDAACAVVFLSHDPKIDDPGLLLALKSDAFYVGALGSMRTQAKRRERLLADGLTELEWARLHGPIGIEIGSQTPAQIALSILSEIIKVRNNVL